MTNATISGVFRTHAQKEYGKVWEVKSTPSLNILALLLKHPETASGKHSSAINV